jgi:putative chitinase
MIMLNVNQLSIACQCNLGRAQKWLIPLTHAMAEFGIDTPARQASFLSQVAHESGRLYYVEEIASGRAYEGRKDLGNTQPGDGERYKGRGLLQITGRNNYAACGKALELDLINHPELLTIPTNAARSAAWFWSTHGLNVLADKGDQVGVTRRINGGVNGLADRLALFQAASKVLA